MNRFIRASILIADADISIAPNPQLFVQETLKALAAKVAEGIVGRVPYTISKDPVMGVSEYKISAIVMSPEDLQEYTRLVAKKVTHALVGESEFFACAEPPNVNPASILASMDGWDQIKSCEQKPRQGDRQ